MSPSNHPRFLSVGITGGIGSGKSAVLAHLEAYGASAYRADDIAKRIMSGKEVTRDILAEFGPAVAALDGGVDREKLSKLVFSDSHARARLNAMVHPLVIERIEAEIERLRSVASVRLAVFEVPLLVEADMVSLFDKVVVVCATPEAQFQRLVEKGMSGEDAVARIRSQVADAERMAHADYILINKSTLESLERESRRLYDALMKEL